MFSFKTRKRNWSSLLVLSYIPNFPPFECSKCELPHCLKPMGFLLHRLRNLLSPQALIRAVPALYIISYYAIFLNPSANIFFAALISPSCFSPHTGHIHSLPYKQICVYFLISIFPCRKYITFFTFSYINPPSKVSGIAVALFLYSIYIKITLITPPEGLYILT